MTDKKLKLEILNLTWLSSWRLEKYEKKEVCIKIPGVGIKIWRRAR